MFPSKKIGPTEGLFLIGCLIVLGILIFFEFQCLYSINKYPLTFSILANIFSGFIAAIVLLYLQEQHYLQKLNKYYSDVAGQYTRIDIGQDNTDEVRMENMIKQNVGLKIILIHNKGKHSFSFSAEYWRNENALTEGTIEFNERNGTLAYGRYRYIKGNDKTIGNSGTYEIYRLEEDKTKLLILFHHLFPRKLENNPDNNRGWEIWQKNS